MASVVLKAGMVCPERLEDSHAGQQKEGDEGVGARAVESGGFQERHCFSLRQAACRAVVRIDAGAIDSARGLRGRGTFVRGVGVKRRHSRELASHGRRRAGEGETVITSQSSARRMIALRAK